MSNVFSRAFTNKDEKRITELEQRVQALEQKDLVPTVSRGRPVSLPEITPTEKHQVITEEPIL